MNDEQSFFASSRDQAESKHTLLVDIGFSSRINWTQRFRLEKHLVWSDTNLTTRRNVGLPDKIKKQSRIFLSESGKSSYSMQINDQFMYIGRPIVVSEFILWRPDCACSIASIKNMSERWDILASSGISHRNLERLLRQFLPEAV
ncbi:hypothetical protein DSO57_1023564 [Entomophthora muscae]|uniref:Uncharacterized protein n=1 Tax=Entomophthora muscae TaxID=34485 RepID=A0ACC2SFT6_9FUNG|nr:hypothetical protein DSO57_1023564 [Entomophthora muscae]